MKILIIGGTGFIGKSFIEFFSGKSGYKIIAPKRAQLNLTNRTNCQDYLKSHKPDIVLHCAVNVDSIEETLKSFFNISSSSSCFHRMLYFGSGAEYNPLKYTPAMTEEASHTSFPESGYPFAKWIIGNNIENSRFSNIVNLRLFGVYGKYEDYSRRFISNNICRVLNGLPISINRDMKFDYLFIDDLCEYVENNFLTKEIKHNTYNVCSGNPVRLTEIAMTIKDIMNVSFPIIIKQQGDNKEYSGNPHRLFNEFGILTATKLSNSIKRMIPFFEKKFLEEPQLKKIFLRT